MGRLGVCAAAEGRQRRSPAAGVAEGPGGAGARAERREAGRLALNAKTQPTHMCPHSAALRCILRGPQWERQPPVPGRPSSAVVPLGVALFPGTRPAGLRGDTSGPGLGDSGRRSTLTGLPGRFNQPHLASVAVSLFATQNFPM